MNKPRYKRPAAIDLGDLHVSIVRGPNAEGRWYWRARDADRATVWTGWATRDEAAREGAAILARPQPSPAQHGLKTVAELIAAWLSAQRSRPDLSPSTLINYTNRARHLTAQLGDQSISALKREHLERYVAARLEDYASIRSVRGDLVSLRHAWRVGVERGLIPYGQPPQVRLRIDERVYSANHRTPTPDEVATVIAALDGEEALLVQLLAATGARVGEVLALRRDQIDPARGLLRLDGKTGPRDFPLTEGLLRLVADRLDGTHTPLIVPTVDHPQQRLRYVLTRACAALGVSVFTPHGLRRMAVDRMARAGVEPAVAASITGHDPVVMLKHYRVVTDDDLRQAAQLADLGRVIRLTPRAEVAP
jgi:integrase